MTSARRIKANRANAQASSGPKTAQGKLRAAQNSRRHGLSLSVISDPVLSEQVEALAREITGGATEDHQLACRIAEAQIDLIRIRRARNDFLARFLSDPNYEASAAIARKGKIVIALARRIGPMTPMSDDVLEFLNAKPKGPVKFATILSDKARELLAMDRYERRAFSRRKFAIRAFDLAHGGAGTSASVTPANTSRSPVARPQLKYGS